MQVLGGRGLVGGFLIGGSGGVGLTQMASEGWKRVGLLGGVLVGSALIYFLAIWASGLKLRQLLKP